MKIQSLIGSCSLAISLCLGPAHSALATEHHGAQDSWLFMYNSTTGAYSSGLCGPNGFLAKATGYLDANWSHIAPGKTNKLRFYRASTGEFNMATRNDDGVVPKPFWIENQSTGWTHQIPFGPDGQILYYNSKITWWTTLLPRPGKDDDFYIQGQAWDAPLWTHVIPLGPTSGKGFAYDATSGKFSVIKRADFNWLNIAFNGVTEAGWTSVTPLIRDWFLFHKGDGTYRVVKVNHEKQSLELNPIYQRKTKTDWSIVTSCGAGDQILLYDAIEGRMEIAEFDPTMPDKMWVSNIQKNRITGVTHMVSREQRSEPPTPTPDPIPPAATPEP